MKPIIHDDRRNVGTPDSAAQAIALASETETVPSGAGAFGAMLIGLVVVVVLMLSRGAFGQEQMGSIAEPIVVDVTLGMDPAALIAAPELGPMVTEAVLGQLLPSIDANPHQRIALRLRQDPLCFDALQPRVRNGLFLTFGSDAPSRYERALAAQLVLIMNGVVQARGGAALSVYALPLEPRDVGEAAALRANENYRPVIERLSAFVSDRSFLLMGGSRSEADLVLDAMPEAVRLSDQQPLVYRTNGEWRALLPDELMLVNLVASADGGGSFDQNSYESLDGDGSTATGLTGDIDAALTDDPYAKGGDGTVTTSAGGGGRSGPHNGGGGGKGGGGGGSGGGGGGRSGGGAAGTAEAITLIDCNSNGISDTTDISNGAADCDGNAVPDECETLADSDADGTPDCLDSCPDDPAKLDPGACGCGVADVDANADGIPDCLDCNDNGIHDSTDIAQGLVADCNANSVPDSCETLPDSDGDGTPDCADGCPNDAGKLDPGSCGCGVVDLDTDGDGAFDCADACPADPNKTDPGDCGCGVVDVDSDGDGVADCADACPADPNKIEPGDCGCGEFDLDSDGDGTADCFDACPNDPNKLDPGDCGCGVSDADTDGDGISDCNDPCPDDPNKLDPGACGCGNLDVDSDGDGALDCDDACPSDPNKVDPGACGCGVSDIDSNADGIPDCFDCNDNGIVDGDEIAQGSISDCNNNGRPDDCEALPDADADGIPDCADGCPNDAAKTDPGNCGCGVADVDTDGDGTLDCFDACPDDPDKTDPGACGCGVEDLDSDADGTPDCFDLCPNDPNKTDPGDCGCGIEDLDTDGDGTADCVDGCPDDASKLDPGVCGCGVSDFDSDGDGTPDCDDNCPLDPNKTQPGACGCDAIDVDSDGDGTLDCEDLCPLDPNKASPGDCGCGSPDVDTDGDGVLDCLDACPDDPAKIDPGACGCGVADQDSDGDGIDDCDDGCPNDAAKTDPGQCGCGVPDTDTDLDGTADCDDQCPDDPNKVVPGDCGCGVPESSCAPPPADLGWTDFTPSADTQIIYVSSSEGSDVNTGFLPNQPVQTIAAGVARLRDGFPDWLLLKRGDVWQESLSSWRKSGRSNTERMVVGHYGEDVARPMLQTGVNSGITILGTARSHLAFMGLEMYPHLSDGSALTTGIFLWTQPDSGELYQNILFEDCYVHHYKDNVNLQNPMENIRLFRCIITDAYDRKPVGVPKSQGIFVKNTLDVTIEECFVAHNGWLDDGSSVTGPNIFNHNIYMQSLNGTISVRRNIITDSSSHGLQLRPGGLCEDNIFIRNPIAVMLGGGDSPVPGGVWALCTGNVILEGNDIDAANGRGFGIDLMNMSSGTVSNNIVANKLSTIGGYFSIGKSVGGGPGGVGVQNITISGNTIYNWNAPIYFNNNCSNVRVLNNIVQETGTTTRPLISSYTFNNAEVLFSGNTYHSTRSIDRWYWVNASNVSASQWQLTAETDMVQDEVSFVDPSRSTATYAQQVGAGTSHEELMSVLRQRSRMNWSQEYTIDALLAYFRAGFEQQ